MDFLLWGFAAEQQEQQMEQMEQKEQMERMGFMLWGICC